MNTWFLYSIFFFPFTVFAQTSVPLWSRATGELEIVLLEHSFTHPHPGTMEIGLGLNSENLITAESIFTSSMILVGFEKENFQIHLGGGWNSSEKGVLVGGEIALSLGKWKLAAHGEGIQTQDSEEKQVFGHFLAQAGYQGLLPKDISVHLEIECNHEEDFRFCGGGPGLSFPIGNAHLSWSLQSSYFEWLGDSPFLTNMIISTVRIHAHFHLLEE